MRWLKEEQTILIHLVITTTPTAMPSSSPRHDNEEEHTTTTIHFPKAEIDMPLHGDAPKATKVHEALLSLIEALLASLCLTHIAIMAVLNG